MKRFPVLSSLAIIIAMLVSSVSSFFPVSAARMIVANAMIDSKILPTNKTIQADTVTQPIIGAYWQGTPAAASISPMVNMILYAFASPSGGTCNTPNSTAKSRINSLSTLKTNNPAFKVIISIGGWGAGGFGADAATDASRQTFVASCIARWISVFPVGLVNGFDIDWEFPVSGGLPSIGSSPNDRANLNLLVQEFRTELNAYAAANSLPTSSMLMTAALPAGRTQDAGDGVHGAPYDQNTSFDINTLGQLLDYVNLMTYDLCTGYSTVSCYNDPLVQRSGDPNDQFNNVEGGIQYMEAHGMPAQKMLLGFPFYGRYFNVTSSNNGGLYQTWTSSTTVNYSSLVGSSYIGNSAYLMGWDPSVASPYLWKPSTKTWVSYENPQSVTFKSQYAKDNGLGGASMWTLGSDDSQSSLLRAMARPWVTVVPAVGAAPVVSGTNFSASSMTAPIPFSGQVATVSDPDTLASGETAKINWGDNTVPASTGVVSGTGGSYVVTGTHTYAAPGSYYLTITVGDGDPINSISSNATATIALDQTIGFSSTAPSAAEVGGATYTPTANATSGLSVAFTIDTSASLVCSISGGVVSFTTGGTCVIDATQPGNTSYNAAPQVQQSFTVFLPQTINFTSTAPSLAEVGGTTYSPSYGPAASATSGLPVAFTIDTTASSVCSISGGVVSFTTTGTCVIDANQPGNTSYDPAPQVQQSFPVYQDVLVSPLGASGDAVDWGGITPNIFQWTGVPGATQYRVNITGAATVTNSVYDVGSGPDLVSCDGSLNCTLSPTATASLAAGTYTWKVQDSGSYGPGAWSSTGSFTLSACYSLTTAVSPSGSGTVTPAGGTTCTGGSYKPGTTVSLTASPASGYVFSNWSGNASDTTSPVSVVMSGNKLVTANFRVSATSVLVLPMGASGDADDWGSITPNTFAWTGVAGATQYRVNVVNGATIINTVYSLGSGANLVSCDGALNCTLSPTGTASLAAGTYTWKVQDIGAYGTGNWSSTGTFTLGACYSLTTAVSPSGTGTVTPSGATCTNGNYKAGTTVSLTAAPASGNIFSNWSGSASGTANPGSVVMSGNKSVTANFRAPLVILVGYDAGTNTFSWIGVNGATQYRLYSGHQVYSKLVTITNAFYTVGAGVGQVHCDGALNCTLSPAATANPAPGTYSWKVQDYGDYGFGNWSSSMSFTIPSTLISPLGASGDAVDWGGITPNIFQWTGVPGATQYRVNITGAATVTNSVYDVGSGPDLVSCDGSLNCTLSPTATASLAAGTYTWKVQDSGSYGPGAWSSTGSFTLSACYSLTTAVSPSGSGTVTPAGGTTCTGGNYKPGTTVSLTAAPAAGYVFSNWSGNASGTTSPVSVVMSGNKSVTANFRVSATNVLVSPIGASGDADDWGGLTPNTFAWTGVAGATQYRVNVVNGATIINTVYNLGSGANLVSCDGALNCTLSPTGTASLAAGTYTWKVQDSGAYGTGSWSGTQTFTLGACYTLTTAVSPSGTGTVAPSAATCTNGNYKAGTTVSLTAAPASGNIFSNWSGSASGTANPGSVVMSGNKSVTANFRAPLVILVGYDAGTNTFSWTGVNGATQYRLNVTGATTITNAYYAVGTGVGQVQCDGALNCTLSPAATAGLASGSYTWKVQDSGVYGSGTWTATMPISIP